MNDWQFFPWLTVLGIFVVIVGQHFRIRRLEKRLDRMSEARP